MTHHTTAEPWLPEPPSPESTSGWCPVCNLELHNVGRSGKGLCDQHGWVWAEFSHPGNIDHGEAPF